MGQADRTVPFATDNTSRETLCWAKNKKIKKFCQSVKLVSGLTKDADCQHNRQSIESGRESLQSEMQFAKELFLMNTPILPVTNAIL